MSIFKNKLDSFLVMTLVIQIAMIIAGSLFPKFFVFWCVALFCFGIFLYVMNYQVIGHNFIHHRFFNNNRFNEIFSIINSIGLGMPQSLYEIYHMNHHRYNNDMPDLFTHTTQDYSSIYRYSDNLYQPENFWSYTFKSVFRMDWKLLFKMAADQGKRRLVLKEIAAIVLFWAILIYFNFYGFLFFYLPTWFLGQCAAAAQNYCEHFRATPGNRLTDSVSCYDWFYNFIWFNNGHHQEHHFRPDIHWSRIPSIRKDMLPINQRMVVKGAHWFNF